MRNVITLQIFCQNCNTKLKMKLECLISLKVDMRGTPHINMYIIDIVKGKTKKGY